MESHVTLDSTLLSRLDFRQAVEDELKMANRLMPGRLDRAAMVARSDDVARWLRNRYSSGQFGDNADIVFVDKNRRGQRPTSEMSLRDRVLFRALVNLIAESLPPNIATRPKFEQFATSPLDSVGVSYVSKTDVTSFYEYVDHGVLADELEAQTGEAPAIDALMRLLAGVMGRRVGLPQVHKSSDTLGDAYIDPVRRRMRRAGYEVTTYSDDFRIASDSLAGARQALEACAREARAIGLTLNESKTFTYTKENYRDWLSSFSEAEQVLFEDSSVEDDDLQLLFQDDYSDDVQITIPDQGPDAFPDDDDDVLTPSTTDRMTSFLTLTVAQERAAARAWQLWIQENQSDTSFSSLEVSATQKMLKKALPILGQANNEDPLPHLSKLLRGEPALTPQIAAYLAELGEWGPEQRQRIRRALDALVAEANFSVWQQLWIAEAAGSIRAVKGTPAHYEWLEECVATSAPALAATAAAALGRLRRGNSDQLTRALDRVGPAWRTLVLWGLARIDHTAAAAAADNRLEHILVEEVPQSPAPTS